MYSCTSTVKPSIAAEEIKSTILTVDLLVVDARCKLKE